MFSLWGGGIGTFYNIVKLGCLVDQWLNKMHHLAEKLLYKSALIVKEDEDDA